MRTYLRFRHKAMRWIMPVSMGAVGALALLPADTLRHDEKARGNPPSSQIVAPNLVIVMANGFSMNREMDDLNYPNVASPASELIYDSGPNINKPTGATWNLSRSSEQLTSKFVQAKRAISTIMDDNSLSANVNVGFATWRQVFAQPVYAVTATLQDYYGRVYPIDQSIFAATTSARFSFGSSSTNFTAFETPMFPAAAATNCPSDTSSTLTNTRPSGQAARIGKNICDGGKGVIKESTAAYLTAAGGMGGLPTVVVPNHLGGYWDLWSNAYGAGYSQNNYSAPDNFQRNAYGFFEKPSKPPNRAHLCGTAYNSEYNTFLGHYLLDYDYQAGVWPELWTFRFEPFDSNNEIVAPGRKETCSGETKTVNQTTKLIGKRLRKAGGSVDDDVYGTTIMPFYVWSGVSKELLPNGVINGWSGENRLIDGGLPSEQMTASYPSGPAKPENPGIPGRFLNSKKLLKKPVTHMGVFLDLPDPAAGYVDQRATIKDFMIEAQMSATGEDYDPVTQKIAPDANGKSTKGVRASDGGWDNQSPVYDSLLGATAYYDAYKKADPSDACRSNHVLLLYDGRENSRYTTDPVTGKQIWADPAEVAKKLKDELNVSTHVIIISRVAGDISEANRIAQEGGTTQAYVIGNFAQLQTAIRNVFASLQLQIATTAPAVPLYVKSGDTAYSPYTFNIPAYGTVRAHTIQANGTVDPTPLWDADAKMTAALRKTNLYSSPGGTIATMMSVAASAFGLPPSSTLTADTIKEFTVDPSFAAGAYLAGRKKDSFLGRMSSMLPAVLSDAMSPELSRDPAYRSYTQGLGAGSKLVVFGSNDGFLYAINQNGVSGAGELRWGWMPPQFLPRLQAFDSFQSSKAMDGELRVADVKSGSGFSRYLMGVVDKGRIHFALELSSSGGLTRVAWVDDSGAPGDPLMAPEVIRDSSGVASAVYLRGETISIRNIVSGSATTISLSGLSASASLRGFHIARKVAYFGSAEGKVYSVSLTGGTPTLVGSMTMGGAGSFAETAIESITSAVVESKQYLSVQANKRLTVFSRDLNASQSTAWDRVWSTAVSGVDSAAGASTSPDQIPPSGRFSAPAQIIEGVIVAPITIDGAGAGTAKSCLAGTANLFFYDLKDGTFPKERVIDQVDGKALASGRLAIGVGDALKLRLTQLEVGRIGAFASAQGAAAGSNTSSALISIKGSGTKMMWWKEVDRDQY